MEGVHQRQGKCLTANVAQLPESRNDANTTMPIFFLTRPRGKECINVLLF